MVTGLACLIVLLQEQERANPEGRRLLHYVQYQANTSNHSRASVFCGIDTTDSYR